MTSDTIWKGACRLQVWVLLVRQRHGSRFGHFLLVLIEQFLVDLDLRRSESGRGDELQLRVADQFTGQPEERLLKVVVGLGRNIVVLEVLLAVESDCLGLDFSFLDIDFVTAEDDGDAFADADEITCIDLSMPDLEKESEKNLRCQLGTFL